jgi:hypothetical protein
VHQPQRWGMTSTIANDVLRAKDAIILMVAGDREEWKKLSAGSVNAHHFQELTEGLFVKKLEGAAELLA